ncbi:rRNA maturation RNase YbeY [Spiroplasma tabanidicola]|uniref:Endoribonuclease YbeY n=1 Tax=Spiroplasma tabanidicola TaxID=324079 RepID=A0A6I6CCT7_9MOLU|nr:rRNA maturation RNase YbeY [Spiroplasma tabanidicola]QGS52108.1 rRNA maturation factor [Spiroplasma tabanidicola]
MDEISFIYEDDNIELTKYETIFETLLKITKMHLNINQTLLLSVFFILPEKSILLNKTYRNKEYVGDVISFPIDDPSGIYDQIGFKEIGDIFITYNEAQNKALKYKHKIDDEMCWLFVHGLLHVLGYDHEVDEKQEKIMFNLTESILKEVNVMYDIVV